MTTTIGMRRRTVALITAAAFAGSGAFVLGDRTGGRDSGRPTQGLGLQVRPEARRERGPQGRQEPDLRRLGLDHVEEDQPRWRGVPGRPDPVRRCPDRWFDTLGSRRVSRRHRRHDHRRSRQSRPTTPTTTTSRRRSPDRADRADEADEVRAAHDRDQDLGLAGSDAAGCRWRGHAWRRRPRHRWRGRVEARQRPHRLGSAPGRRRRPRRGGAASPSRVDRVLRALL